LVWYSQLQFQQNNHKYVVIVGTVYIQGVFPEHHIAKKITIRVARKNILPKSKIFLELFPFFALFLYRGTKNPSFPLFCTLIIEYPNHRLHTTDLAATQGAFRQVRPGFDAMRLPNRSGAPPEAGEVAWNTYLKRRVSNHDTHRGDALKASAVLPTMWYRKWELFPAAGPVVRPYIRGVVSNRV